MVDDKTPSVVELEDLIGPRVHEIVSDLLDKRGEAGLEWEFVIQAFSLDRVLARAVLRHLEDQAGEQWIITRAYADGDTTDAGIFVLAKDATPEQVGMAMRWGILPLPTKGQK